MSSTHQTVSSVPCSSGTFGTAPGRSLLPLLTQYTDRTNGEESFNVKASLQTALENTTGHLMEAYIDFQKSIGNRMNDRDAAEMMTRVFNNCLANTAAKGAWGLADAHSRSIRDPTVVPKYRVDTQASGTIENGSVTVDCKFTVEARDVSTAGEDTAPWRTLKHPSVQDIPYKYQLTLSAGQWSCNETGLPGGVGG